MIERPFPISILRNGYSLVLLLLLVKDPSSSKGVCIVYWWQSTWNFHFELAGLMGSSDSDVRVVWESILGWGYFESETGWRTERKESYDLTFASEQTSFQPTENETWYSEAIKNSSHVFRCRVVRIHQTKKILFGSYSTIRVLSKSSHQSISNTMTQIWQSKNPSVGNCHTTHSHRWRCRHHVSSKWAFLRHLSLLNWFVDGCASVMITF